MAKKSPTSECPICCETVSKTPACPHCQYQCCVKCWKTYIHTKVDTQCLSCHHILNIMDLSIMFPLSYIHSEYREYMSNILFNKQRPLIREAEKKRQVKLIKKQVEGQIKTLKKSLYDIKIEVAWAKINKNDTTPIQSRKRQMLQEYNTLKRHKKDIPAMLENNHFQKCANCDDAIIPTSMEVFCARCQLYTCIHCQKTTASLTDHLCHEDDLETQKILKEETRACPGCDCLIYKIDGCSQMWCSQCHTTFDWNTMEIEKHRLHNPHFYEYQKKLYNGQLPEYEWGGEKRILSKEDIVFIWENFTEDKAKLETLHNVRNHLDFIESCTIYQLAHEFDIFDIPLTRKRYVEKKTKESVFKNTLWRMEKKKQKEIQDKRILKILVSNCADILHEFTFFDITVDDAIAKLNKEYDLCCNRLQEVSQILKLPMVEY